MVRLFLLVLGLLALAQPGLAQGKVHFVLVADTNSNLAEDVLADLNAIAGLIGTTIPKTLRQEVILQGKQVTPDEVLETVTKINPGPQDAIVVMINCHGGTRMADTDSHTLVLHGSGKAQGLPRKELRNILLAKTCRLKVLITDACSTIPSDTPRKVEQDQTPRVFLNNTDAPELTAVQKALLFDSKGVVDINAAREGTLSFSDQKGGVFCKTFTNLVQAQAASGQMTWVSLYDKLIDESNANYKTFRDNHLKRLEGIPEERRTADEKKFYLDLKGQSKQNPQAYSLPGLQLGVGVAATMGLGVEVTDVNVTSPAYGKLKIGDIITEANGAPIKYTQDWKRVIVAALGQGQVEHTFQVQGKDGQTRTVTIRLTPRG